ncbi:MAG: polysaccharide pyruvyl transferase family protein [Pseudomonadota bacterium]
MTRHTPGDLEAWPASGAPLTVEVVGIDPENQGACLMLLAIKQELSRRFPHVRIGVDVATPFEDRMRLGVWGVTPADWQMGWGAKRAKGWIASSFAQQRHRIGLLNCREIDLVLDASGFAYGDYWGPGKFDHFIARRMPFWTKHNTQRIALPQAWGPFSAPAFQKNIARQLSEFDLVYARDGESFDHLRSSGVMNVREAPDFTNLLTTNHDLCPAKYRGYAILIPNAKLVAQADATARASYLDFMQNALMSLSLTSDRVGVLIHEGKGDRQLASELNGSFDLIDPRDALTSKHILAQARAVVSGRYHGLVSALSAGVPSLACAWSHKYQHLMNDYGLDWACATLRDTRSDLESLARLVALTEDEPALSRLHERAAAQKRAALQCWDEIARAIHQNARIPA